MNVFIGLDVSLRSVAMCVLGAEGDLIEEATWIARLRRSQIISAPKAIQSNGLVSKPAP